MPTNLCGLFQDEDETIVVNIARGQRCDVFIGRPGFWGNPYSHKDGTLAEFKVATREEAVKKYQEYVLKNLEMMKRLCELKGKRLGCFCVPKSCHGTILKNLVKQYCK